MFSLEEQIKRYTDENFSAEAESQHFFKSYGEADISKKLNEMSTIQQSIETVLRQKVRSNYNMFLLANDEINQVDEEMSDLKHLITNTQKLIDDVQSNRIAESRAMRTNSFLGSFGDEFRKQDESESAMSKAVADAKNSVPAWLTKAPEELAQYIVEQQYAKAVVIVLKTRAYVNTISQELQATNSRTTATQKNYRNAAAASQAAEIAAAAAQAQTQALVEVLNKIDELCVHLAVTIRKSVLNLPTSQLWGKSEQITLLKLLIALEEFEMAAEGFAVTKVSSIKRALRSVDSTGDTVTFTAELSLSFFTALQEGCATFGTLFEEHYNKPEILHLLLTWVQKQIALYVEILIPHMHAGITDLTNSVLNQLRKACAAAAASSGGGAGSALLGSRDLGDAFPDLDGIYGGDNGPTIQSLVEELVGTSPLGVLSGCLEAAFSAAHLIDSPQLQGSSCLGWVMVPEVQVVVTQYAERFIEQVGAQVQQDSWQPVVLADLAVRSPAKDSSGLDYLDMAAAEEGEDGAAGYMDDASQHAVSRSYEWLLAVINHLSSEIWKLLKAEEDDEHDDTDGDGRDTKPASTNSNTGKGGQQAAGAAASAVSKKQPSSSYTRADICEVEPVAASCLIRLFLRYIVEVEGLATKGFTKVQLACYVKTLEAVQAHMLPSLKYLVSTCFFAEGVNTLHASPSYVFKTLAPRLAKLLKDKQGE